MGPPQERHTVIPIKLKKVRAGGLGKQAGFKIYLTPKKSSLLRESVSYVRKTMKGLEPRDSVFLQAARNCLESGQHLAAHNELARLAAEFGFHPDVLEVRWAIQAQANQWQSSLESAQAIVDTAPGRPTGWIKRSFVLHRLKRTQEALDELFPAAERFSDIAVIPYNLACYAAQLQCFWEAKRWLKQAIEMGSELKLLALRDPNLEPLWEKLTQP